MEKWLFIRLRRDHGCWCWRGPYEMYTARFYLMSRTKRTALATKRRKYFQNSLAIVKLAATSQFHLNGDSSFFL